MTSIHCIAFGRGPKEARHFNFYDIDTKDFDLPRIMSEAPDALIIGTNRGLHLVSPVLITSEYVLSLADPKCPGNAVRWYPHDDLILLRRASSLCVKVAKAYESVFDGRIVTEKYLPCFVPLKMGQYTAEKDGIKLHGDERTIQERERIEAAETQ